MNFPQLWKESGIDPESEKAEFRTLNQARPISIKKALGLIDEYAVIVGRENRVKEILRSDFIPEGEE